jgi:chlorophyll(ide) b reductase
VIETNIVGTLTATKAAIAAMREQTQKGNIFLMEGGGSNGMATPNYATYGVSKVCSWPRFAFGLNRDLL